MSTKDGTAMSIGIVNITIFFLALGGLSLSAQAASNNISSGMGHDLAQAKCSGCHLVEPGQKNPPDHVGGPAFQTIAGEPDITAENLRKHLTTTHSNKIIPLKMPNPGLSQDELNKIIDYLMSLKKTETR
jgi:mono/diheme cytochrome c family protein